MGVYDRDWWRDRYNKQAKASEDAAKRAIYNPREFRGEKTPKAAASRPVQPPIAPPDLPGSGWHWSIKIVFLGWCAMLLYLAAKLAMGMRL